MAIEKRTVDAARSVQDEARKMLSQARRLAKEAEGVAEPDKKSRLEQAVRTYAASARKLSKAARDMLKSGA